MFDIGNRVVDEFTLLGGEVVKIAFDGNPSYQGILVHFDNNTLRWIMSTDLMFEDTYEWLEGDEDDE